MLLSRAQFDQRLHEESLTMSLIGMSNIGKSYWSGLLTELAFEHVDVDAQIEERLGLELQQSGHSGTSGMSAWMGQPFDLHYMDHQRIYLDHEIDIMALILTMAENHEKGNTVIDTTGSVIHTGARICERLKEKTLVVYIEANEDQVDALYRQYFIDPKPTIFGHFYQPMPGESVDDAMHRAYRALLLYRGQMYREYADVTIKFEDTVGLNNPGNFLRLIRQAL